MADDQLNVNDDELNELIEQLGELENLNMDLNELSEESLTEMAESVTEDELDVLLSDNALDDDDASFADFLANSASAEDGDSENTEDDVGSASEAYNDNVYYEEPMPEAQSEPEDAFEDSGALAALLGGSDAGYLDFDETISQQDEEIPEAFDYLNVLSGGGIASSNDLSESDLLLDEIEKQTSVTADDFSEDDGFLPDFSFNESFTTSSAGRPEVTKTGGPLRKRKEKRKASKEASEKEKPEKRKLVSLLPGPIREKAEAFQLKAEEKRKARKPLTQKAKMLVTIVVMLLVLLVSSFFLYGQYKKMTSLIAENEVIVKTPTFQFNYANYIYTENKKTFNGQDLILTKLIIDEYKSAFYLDRRIPMDRCYAELRDDCGNYYAAYMPLMSRSPDEESEEETTALWFSGVKKEAEKLVLTIWDSETKAIAEFEVDMKNYDTPAAKYIKQPKGIRTDSGIYNLTVEGGTFSSAMSTVVYRIEEKSDVNVVYETGVDSLTFGYLVLDNTERGTAPLLERSLLYRVNDDIAVGRMDFYPVRSLDNKARLTFVDLSTYYNLNQTLSAEPLFDYKVGNEMRIKLDKFSLVLEGMRQYPGRFVLVYHLEDETGERIDGQVDIGLLAKTYTGLEIRLNPFTRSKTEGGDILFDYQSPNSVLDNVQPENVFLEVRSAALNLPDAITDINLPAETQSADEANYAEVTRFIEAAYLQRLAVKSEAADANSLQAYFEDAILSDENINRLYEPQKTTVAPEYAVSVNILSKISRFEYFAVVDESWLGISGTDRTHYYQTHKIIVKQIGNKYVISSDMPEIGD